MYIKIAEALLSGISAVVKLNYKVAILHSLSLNHFGQTGKTENSQLAFCEATGIYSD